jgi:hypothetical protein
MDKNREPIGQIIEVDVSPLWEMPPICFQKKSPSIPSFLSIPSFCPTVAGLLSKSELLRCSHLQCILHEGYCDVSHVLCDHMEGECDHLVFCGTGTIDLAAVKPVEHIWTTMTNLYKNIFWWVHSYKTINCSKSSFGSSLISIGTEQSKHGGRVWPPGLLRDWNHRPCRCQACRAYMNHHYDKFVQEHNSFGFPISY